MPSHYHACTATAKVANISTGSGYTAPVINTYGNDNGTAVTSGTGGGSAHDNMPAYQTLYAWRRTA